MSKRILFVSQISLVLPQRYQSKNNTFLNGVIVLSPNVQYVYVHAVGLSYVRSLVCSLYVQWKQQAMLCEVIESGKRNAHLSTDI